MEETRIHIYRAEAQPATRWRPAWEDAPMIRNNPRKQLRCFTCGRRRYARNLTVHAYYDGVYFYCRRDCRRERRA